MWEFNKSSKRILDRSDIKIELPTLISASSNREYLSEINFKSPGNTCIIFENEIDHPNRGFKKIYYRGL